MENEVDVIVTSAFVYKDKIHGISEQGHLTVFDDNIGRWITRGKAGMIPSASAENIKKTMTNPEPVNRYQNSTYDRVVNDEYFEFIHATAFWWAAGVSIVSVVGLVAWYFIR